MTDRELPRRLSYAIVFLFVLTFATSGTAYWLSVSAVHRAQMSAASTVQLCEAGNRAREQQVQLWTYIVTISRPPPHETAAHRQQREATVRRFIAHLRAVFAPRDCQKGFAP